MAQSTTEKAREAVGRLKPGEHELTPAAKTIAAAATAAVAGGLAAALKALVEHRSDAADEGHQEDNAEPEQDREQEPKQQQQQEEEKPKQEREEAQPEARAGGEDERTELDEPEQQEEARQEEPRAAADDQRDDRRQENDEQQDDDRSDGRQAPNGGAARIVEAGKNELEVLLGQQVESISGFSRSGDGWCVTYEVVEMRRIPDSSDVLSSYAVVLDDDGELMNLERKHRYRRAQVDDG